MRAFLARPEGRGLSRNLMKPGADAVVAHAGGTALGPPGRSLDAAVGAPLRCRQRPMVHEHGAGRLALARSMAWAVHTSGWLVLGAVGARQLPLWLGGLLPTALWLGLLAFVLQARAGQALTAATARAAWLLAAGFLALAAAAAQPLWLAPGWAAAAAAASWTVRLSRDARRSPWQHAVLPAAVGVAAGGAVGVMALLGGTATGLAGPALLVLAAGAWLTRGRAPARHACRRGALDEWRALQGLDARGWWTLCTPLDLPQRVAAAAMLPMMAGLPTLLALCTADTRPAAVVVLHLGAMVLPALCLGGTRRAVAARDASRACAGLLIAGGLALPALPLLQGLMVATVCHTMAWSVAWTTDLQGGSRCRVAASRTTPRAAALCAAAGVSMLGAALASFGPRALWLTHAALAVLALLWTLAQAWHRAGLAARR